MPRKIRVLVGKPGLDGHDRGAKVVAAALRDAGMEVIYTGLHQTPVQVVEAALQEDVDVVALSILSGAHMTLFPEVLKLMKERGIGDKLLSGGGIIPPEDMDTLASMGVGRLFGPGASTQDIVDYLRTWFGSKHGADALGPLPPRPPLEPLATGFVSSKAAPQAPVATRERAKPKRASGTRRRKPLAGRSSRPSRKTAKPRKAARARAGTARKAASARRSAPKRAKPSRVTKRTARRTSRRGR